jgi:acyl-homoserine lactone acylase PvdQ
MSFSTPEHPEDATNDANTRPDLNLTHRRSDENSDQPPTPRRILLKRFLRAAGVLALLAVLIVLTSALAFRHAMHASLPQNLGLLDGNISIAGISAPVTVTRDAQGVPSIHAANLDDLLFSQGYITASDRLFQMDALRRHGAGELAEILGPSLIAHDREQRYLQLRAAADRAVAVLPPDELHQLQVYARGVNAFITSHRGSAFHSNTLPVEFHILHYAPALWEPRDSILISLVMSQELSTEFPAKLNREALSAHLPAALLADLYPTDSWRDRPPTQDPSDLTAPAGPVEQIPLDRTQSLNHAPPSLTTPHSNSTLTLGATLTTPQNSTLAVRGGLRAGLQAGPSPQELLTIYSDLRAGLDTPRDPTLTLGTTQDTPQNPTLAVRAGLCDGCRAGSNNWAVSGAHTASGAPLLSNDMHLSLTAPDIWYEASLHASTTPSNTPLDVEGFTLPGVPFVIVGRNPYVAWSFTNSGADAQDVLIEHLRGSGSNTEYERPDHTWSPIGHQIEHIHVRAGRDVTLDVLTTTHSIGNTIFQTPIISPLYPTEHRALALAWTIYDPSTISAPFLAINSAPDAASLVAAFASFDSVTQNLIYADAHHIGYHLLGHIPIRGPAIQRPRAIQPFILPDNTPSGDEEDESGPPDARLERPLDPSSQPQPGHPTSAPARWGGDRAARSGETPVFILASAIERPSSRPQPRPPTGAPARRGGDRAARSRKTPVVVRVRANRHRPKEQEIPTLPTTAYTIGSPISPVPVDALDPTQAWSGYIPYDALPSVLDPPSGILVTANARITPDDYPYFIANDWGDAYRVERINHLLQNRSGLTSADMLAIQTDTHSELDLLVAQRLAYALDRILAHSALAHNDPRLHQAADILRDWNGDVSANSPAAAIVAVTRAQLWPLLLAPQIHAHDHTRMSDQQLNELLELYTWGEKTSALELILQHTPARWLPHAFANWNELLATAVQRGLHFANAPGNLSTWAYGSISTVEIPHPIFGSHSPLSTLLGVPTGSGFHPNGGDGTTIQQTGLHFGPSERFTADLANPDDTHSNITTGESGNPASPWFLDQFLPWLRGTTFTLPLIHPAITHTLTLTPL